MSNKPPTDYLKAIKRIATQEGQLRAARHEREVAIREREVAERQVRSLTHELQAARREIARLQSLSPRQQGN
ncbi:hypothetical protein [Novosphingobium sp.]|uniref:hypothetical protein n=1 Tax=Novosphingobium sp. TaxID=1874826 RepID=UPI001DAA06AF|nr:hypothetical protein [Novosphingobium sp.]MBX9661894.1 hypothetical protein [Novosphingobium sp.]